MNYEEYTDCFIGFLLIEMISFSGRKVIGQNLMEEFGSIYIVLTLDNKAHPISMIERFGQNEKRKN